MKRRKLFLVILTATFLMSNVFVVSAENYREDEIISKDEGCEMAKPIGKLTRTSGLYYHWSSTLGWFTVSAESRATEGDQETPRFIDFIKVVSKIYEEKDLLETLQEENYEAARASVSETYSSLAIAADREIFSTHYFEETGYESAVKESCAQ